MSLFKKGDKVFYNMKETFIEEIFEDGTCIIGNPDWDWDEEAECVHLGIEYDIPYWINVKLSELKKID